MTRAADEATKAALAAAEQNRLKAIERLNRNGTAMTYKEAREAAEDAIRKETNVIDGTALFSAKAALDAALSAFSAAGWELVQKGDGWVRVPIEVENACLNWLANRIQGNSHGEDVELGRLMRGLQTYIKAVANGTNK